MESPASMPAMICCSHDCLIEASILSLDRFLNQFCTALHRTALFQDRQMFLAIYFFKSFLKYSGSTPQLQCGAINLTRIPSQLFILYNIYTEVPTGQWLLLALHSWDEIFNSALTLKLGAKELAFLQSHAPGERIYDCHRMLLNWQIEESEFKKKTVKGFWIMLVEEIGRFQNLSEIKVSPLW